jgi:6-phosphogluconolactonase (cycloisomerase 2 family)
MNTTPSTSRTLVAGSRLLRLRWHVETTRLGVFHFTLPGLLLMALGACGGGSSPAPMPPSTSSTTATYSIGGTVLGLPSGLDSGLVLQINAGNDLAVCTDCGFTFTASLADGSAYTVTVKTQPSSPAQNCRVVGNGSGTVDGANVTDVAVVCYGRFAYAANRGDNSLSVYSIDSTTGALTAVGAPVPAGESPYAIAAGPDGRYVYVVNEGSNNISVYAVNSTSGELTEIPDSPFASGIDPQALTFDPSGAYLYVANTGSDNLSAYAVDAGTGALAPLSPATYATGTGPSAIVDFSGESTSSVGGFVYVANSGGSGDITAFAITEETGALIPIVGSPFAAGGNPHSLVLTAFNPWADYSAFLYTANFDGTRSTISGFSADPNTGALSRVNGSPFALPVSNCIGTDVSGSYLYVTTGEGVVGYSINDTGLLTALTGFPVASGARAFSVTVDSSDQFLYTGNDGSADISGYKLNAANGELTAIPGSPFPAGSQPDFIAIL